MVTNARELISDIKIGGSLGCSGHALMVFTVLRDMGKARSIVRTLEESQLPALQGVSQ